MAVTLPKINITFKQLATSFIQRSERGIVCLVVRDATAGSGGSFFQYGDALRCPMASSRPPTASTFWTP